MPKKKMLLTETVNTKFVLNGSAPLEPGVLAVIRGPFAEFGKLNANNRWYDEELWKLVLNNPSIIENLKRKIIYGELDHPSDHMEVIMDKAAFAITDLRIDESTSTVQGEAKVLDTPAGRILNTLVRFGSVLGMSSRGTGEVRESNGHSEVIPSSYEFITFDVVLNPSNRGALPTLVESVQDDKGVSSSLDAILESIKTADEKQLVLIEEMSKSYDSEMSAAIINKVEERRAVLVPVVEDKGGHDSEEPKVNEPTFEVKALEKLAELTDVIANLSKDITSLKAEIAKITTSKEGPKVEPEDSVEDNLKVTPELVDAKESVRIPIKVRPRLVRDPIINENQESTVVSGGLVEDTETGSVSGRTATLVQQGKSK